MEYITKEFTNDKFGKSFTLRFKDISKNCGFNAITFAERNSSERHTFNRIDNGDNLVDIINEYYGKKVV